MFVSVCVCVPGRVTCANELRPYNCDLDRTSRTLGHRAITRARADRIGSGLGRDRPRVSVLVCLLSGNRSVAPLVRARTLYIFYWVFDLLGEYIFIFFFFVLRFFLKIRTRMTCARNHADDFAEVVQNCDTK